MNRENNASIAKSIGSVIKQLRQKLYPNHGGQIKCAGDFGVSQAEWSRWERGMKAPSPVNLRKIADFFNVSVSELYGEQAPPLNSDQPASSMQQANVVTILNLYRTMSDIHSMLDTLVRDAEQKAVALNIAQETLQSVLQNLKHLQVQDPPEPVAVPAAEE